METTMKAEKEKKMEASSTRKREMQKLEIQRKRNEKPSDLEQVGSSIVGLLKLHLKVVIVVRLVT